MSDAPHRPRPSATRTALKIGWLICVAAILLIPGSLPLLAGMPAATAGLVTLFTTACVSIAAFLVNFR